MENKKNNIINILAIFLIVFSIFFVSFEDILLRTTVVWLLSLFLLGCNIIFFKAKIDLNDKITRYFILFIILLCFISLFANNKIVALKFIIWFSTGVFAYSYFKDRNYLSKVFFKLVNIFSIIFAYITILSVIFPKIYFIIINFLYSSSKVEIIRGLYNQGCYSGIAGQTGHNSFLIILGILITSSILFIRNNNKKHRILNIYNLFILITGLILCNKRMLTVISVLLILLIIIIGNIGKDFKEKFKNIGLYIIYIIYICILLFGFPNTFRLLSRSMEYLETDFTTSFNGNGMKPNGSISKEDAIIDSVLNGRSALYKQAIEYFKHNTVFGIGIDNYTYYENIQAHNSILQLLAEIGLVGTIPLLAIIIYILVITFINLWKHYKNPIYVLAFCSELLILAYSLTGNPFHDFNIRNYYFIVIAFMISIINKKVEDKNKGILTFHLSQNYGAVLQTYALNKKLNNSVIINYYSNSVYDYYNPFNVKKYGKINLLNILKTIYNFKDSYLKMVVFNQFRDNYLDCTPIIYDKNDLVKESNKYKKIITGSDQVWNSKITINDADIYYLNFVTEAKKYAYAASIGNDKINKEEEKLLKDKIANFTKITVREDSAKEILNKLAIKASTIFDPTLLLTSNEWDEISTNTKIKEDYILVYCLDKSQEFIKCVNEASQKYNLKVIHFDKKNTYQNELKNYAYASPNEFISLIKNAKYVITNSFHGTVFSLIYHKQFISIPHRTRSTRQQNLLAKLDLLDRLTDDVGILDQKYSTDNLDKYRIEGLKYIEELNKND